MRKEHLTLADSGARLIGMATLASVLLGAAAAGGADASLDRYRWNNRLVVTFEAANPSSPGVEQRAEQSAMPAEWRDRDLLLIHVDQDGGVTVNDEPAPGLDGTALRDRFGISGDRFTALLIGKDGGVKVRSGSVIENGDLFSTIDAMPMRQSEMGRDN